MILLIHGSNEIVVILKDHRIQRGVDLVVLLLLLLLVVIALIISVEVGTLLDSVGLLLPFIIAEIINLFRQINWLPVPVIADPRIVAFVLLYLLCDRIRSIVGIVVGFLTQFIGSSLGRIRVAKFGEEAEEIGLFAHCDLSELKQIFTELLRREGFECLGLIKYFVLFFLFFSFAAFNNQIRFSFLPQSFANPSSSWRLLLLLIS